MGKDNFSRAEFQIIYVDGLSPRRWRTVLYSAWVAFHAAQGGGRAGSHFTVDKPGELYSGQRHGDESRGQYGPWTGWDRNTLSLYSLLPKPQGLPDKPKSKDNELSDQGFSKLSVIRKKENLGNGQSRGASGERTTKCNPGGDPGTTKEGC